MGQILTQNFLNRVVTSVDKVTFSFADPYGHLSTSRYIEMFVNHRIAAVEEKAGLNTVGMLKELGLAFVFQEIHVTFLVPAMIGEVLDLGSWIESIDESGFEIKGVLSGQKNRRAKALVSACIRSVDSNTGRAIPLPAQFPSLSETDLLSACPTPDDYLKGLKGIPVEFRG